MADKLLPGNETVLLVPAIEIGGIPYAVGPTGVVAFDALTTTVLNLWAAITGPNQAGAGAGGNVSCAIRDDMNLGLSDSDTDGDRTLCSRGQSEELTLFNFDAEINAFRDVSLTDSGVMNLFKALTRAPDVPYLVVHRIGKPSSALFAVNDEIDTYYVWTDNPVPGYGDGANQTTGTTFVAKNIVDIARTLTA